LWCCCVVVEGEVVCRVICARVVGSTGLRFEWRVSGEKKEAGRKEIRRAQRLIGVTRGVRRGTE
jgi:hypothetical protein